MPRQKKEPVTGRLIAAWLRFLGKSRRQLAKDIGVTEGAVGAWIQGWADPAERRIPSIAAALGQSVPQFYEGPPGESAPAGASG